MGRTFGQDESKCAGSMFFGHEGVEIGGGDVVGTSLAGSPLLGETDGGAAKDAQDEHARVSADAAAIIIVRDVQPLVKAVLNAPSLAIQIQAPFLSVPSLTSRRKEAKSAFHWGFFKMCSK